MTFARRLAAVLVLVAAVFALGVTWEHSSEAGWITPPAAGRVPVKAAARGAPGTAVPRAGGRVFRASPRGNGIGLDLSGTGNLTRTAEIEVAAAAGVVLLDVARRRVRQARRASR